MAITERDKLGRVVRKYPTYKRNCVVCGKEFENDQMSVVTCSKVCGYRKIKELNPHKRTERVCPICNKKFIIPNAWINKRGGGDGTYCSKECRWKTRMKWTKNEKQNARSLIRNLVNRGIIEAKNCRICGDPKTEAHHHKGYDRKNWLKVVWLCDKHHHQEHENLRRTGHLYQL